METNTIEKLRRYFDSMVVYKDFRNNNFSLSLSLPSFMRDWLLQKFQDDQGRFDHEKLQDFIRTYIPKPNDWTSIKDRIITDYQQVKLLAKLVIDINVKTGEVSFALPDFALPTSQTMIAPSVWSRCKGNLVSGHETWGMIELGYQLPDDSARPKIPGKIKLLGFRDFCPYKIDIDYFKEARREFSVKEWIDIVLGAVDYNADGYEIAKQNETFNTLPDVETMKMAMISRLLPFVQNRLNLIELAPMGTGKSYLFGQVSRYGWLSTSDKMTRAKFFYDASRNTNGLVEQNDFIVLDEIQKTVFDDGMAAPMQAYLESGKFTIGNHSGGSMAGLVVCGNIPPDIMKADGFDYMFSNLPKMFQDAAMIDRFHGFIKGWNIPRMNENLVMNNWGLNSEYYTAILHDLRGDSSYRGIIDSIIEMPRGADTRDAEAVKRIAEAFLKLLFPHVRSVNDISESDFKRYCFRPALKMRYTIKYQMGLMNEQYRGKDLPQFKLRMPNNEIND